jgi:hypothetical protein
VQPVLVPLLCYLRALAILLQICMDWLGKLLHLPACFLSTGGGTGVIQGTASEATLVALLAARARKLEGRPAAGALHLVAHSSDQAHSAGGSMAGPLLPSHLCTCKGRSSRALLCPARQGTVETMSPQCLQ